MTTYTMEFNNFKGKNETTCSIYNLDLGLDLQMILHKTSSKLCVEYKLVKSEKNNGLSNYNTILKGYVEILITYNQYKNPLKALYIKKITDALSEIIESNFVVTDDELAENKVTTLTKSFTPKCNGSFLSKTRIERTEKEYTQAKNFYTKNYSNLPIGHIININSQQELGYLEYIDSDGIIRIFADNTDNDKVKAIILHNSNKHYLD